MIIEMTWCVSLACPVPLNAAWTVMCDTVWKSPLAELTSALVATYLSAIRFGKAAVLW